MKEVNFDGLVGPTYHYGGLSYGNLASMRNKRDVANPKEAALQGLNKMYYLMKLGIPQAVLPPQERPALGYLRALGFSGSDNEILINAHQTAHHLLSVAYCASAMWRANSASVTPSCDSLDGRVHLTIANLHQTPHRRLESSETERLFRYIFRDPKTFAIHPPLPLDDEGAANHIRFCPSFEKKGTHLYVYGKKLDKEERFHFPLRQAKEASEAIVRLHGGEAIFAKQNPKLIEKGVFHNDVISCGTQNVFMYHPEAFENTEEIIAKIEHFCPLHKIRVNLPIEQAIETYLFNSQLIVKPDQTLLLLAPQECETLNLDWFPFPIEFINLKQSMKNGGGPACLRLAIPLTEEEKKKIHPSIFLTEKLYQTLIKWISTHYRDRLHLDDLGDPLLLQESYEALDALTHILDLGTFYSFQRQSE